MRTDNVQNNGVEVEQGMKTNCAAKAQCHSLLLIYQEYARYISLFIGMA
jgi:hypothetical protein